MLRLIQAPETHPVTLADAKAHCRVVDDEEDAVMEGIVHAAEEFIAARTGHSLAPETYRLELPCFWSGDLKIPAAPLRDVVEVSYIDEADTEIVIDPALYRWRRTPAGGEIWLLKAFTRPTVAEERKDAVRITLDAGYDDPVAASSSPPMTGGDPELVFPRRFRQAILLLVGHWNENREAVLTGTISSTIEFALEALLRQLRIFR